MKPPPPPIDLDEADNLDLLVMKPEELDKVSYDELKWCCCVEGCNNGPTARDYGIRPMVYVRRRWFDLSRSVWYCGKHWKIYNAHVKLRQTWEPIEGFKIGPGINHLISKTSNAK